MARQVAQLILAAALVALASFAGASDLRTPQTPWGSLTSEQKRILGPVAPDWDHMPGYQQQRLMSAAKQYPALQPIQKERFEQRLRDWTAMTPEQRRAARETFQGLRKLPPEKQHELRERWLERQQNYGPQPQSFYGTQRQPYAPEMQRPQYAPEMQRQQPYASEAQRYPAPQQPAYRDAQRRRDEPRETPRGR